jgi:1,4-dihydroxy-2-naphthoyl-CoA hydrolase
VSGETDTSSPSPLLEKLVALMPFSVGLGVVLEMAEPNRVVGVMPWAPERCTSGGVLHGGALMGLADTLGGICAYLNLPEGATTATIESKTNFFRPVRSGLVRGTAERMHVGRSTIVVATELRNDAGHPVAFVVQTQAVVSPS